MRGGLKKKKNFQIIDELAMSTYSRHFFNITSISQEIYYQDTFQKLSLLTNWSFLLIFVIEIITHANDCTSVWPIRN